jgi:hypothetical protein
VEFPFIEGDISDCPRRLAPQIFTDVNAKDLDAQHLLRQHSN